MTGRFIISKCASLLLEIRVFEYSTFCKEVEEKSYTHQGKRIYIFEEAKTFKRYVLLQPALRRLALIPISARRQLNDLPDEMAMKMSILFYADGREALIKALGIGIVRVEIIGDNHG